MLTIRRFNPNIQSRQYLEDLVCGNHSLLVMIERATEDPDLLTTHLTQ